MRPPAKLMKTLCIFAVLLTAVVRPGCAATPPKPSPSPTPPQARPVPPISSKIDGFIFSRLKQQKIEPAQRCDDPTFLRRVYLDVIGTLPTMKEAREFLADTNPQKRPELIDRLLARPEFAEYWGMKWCDLLRVKAEFPVNLWPNAAQAYDRWIRNSIRENIPYSKFAFELLTANGSNFREPQANFYRSAGSKDPKAIARAVALTFMGERAEKWPESKQAEMAAFFSQIGFKPTNEWKEEIVYFAGIDSGKAQQKKATLPDGTRVELSPGKDPREIFAQWLIASPKSPFARNAVNRVWFWLMGRGIVQEPDDWRPSNPPSHPALVEYLAQELVASHYDIKPIYRLILNSRAYQLSSVPSPGFDSKEAANNFAFYPVRRLEAETVIDAIDQITGSTEEYSSMIPEPFTWVPTETRAISLPDGSIGSAFLDLFGRPPRDTGLLSERSDRPSAGQRLQLLNSTHIQAKINKSQALQWIFNSSPKTPLQAVNQIYLTVLSRYPTPDELAVLKRYTQNSEVKGKVLVDLTWALLNSSEFLYRH